MADDLSAAVDPVMRAMLRAMTIPDASYRRPDATEREIVEDAVRSADEQIANGHTEHWHAALTPLAAETRAAIEAPLRAEIAELRERLALADKLASAARWTANRLRNDLRGGLVDLNDALAAYDAGKR